MDSVDARVDSVDPRVDSVHSVSVVAKPFIDLETSGERAKYCQKSWFDAFELLHHDTRCHLLSPLYIICTVRMKGKACICK